MDRGRRRGRRIEVGTLTICFIAMVVGGGGVWVCSAP